MRANPTGYAAGVTPLLLGAALAAPVGDIWVRAPDAVTRAELDALGLVHAHGRAGEWGQYVGQLVDGPTFL